MDTRAKAKEYRLGHWAGIMQERTSSGLNIRSYCAQSGICENVYYYWQRKLRETACDELLPATQKANTQEIAPGGWAVCEEREDVPASCMSVMSVIEIGKFRLNIAPDASAAEIEKICQVLLRLC